MDSNRFLDRLYGHPATTSLAEVLSDLISARHASATRRAGRGGSLHPDPGRDAAPQ